MQLPLQITFRNIDTSEAVEAKIRERAAELDQFYDRITGCRVTIEAATRKRHKGRLYNVRVDLKVPSREIVINHSSDDDHSHEDIYVAVRDAFDAARRQLQDHVRLSRGDVKTHDAP
ncbi:MAG TPA: HPF/RaiA family ribosome-associated protein [Stellaceae bacterium]|nr:HPF/RaiA family ribosome-associated protein [Stellaceae bacterium]